MTGSEVSVEVMAIDGEIHILAITDKITTGPPYFVEMGHSQPSQLPETTQKRIKDLAVKAMQALNINNGPAHVEIMATADGPKMIELGARMGGDNITTHLVPLSTGIDMVKATIEVCLGYRPDISPRLKKASAIKYLDVAKGIITSISGVESALSLKGVANVVINKNIGEIVSDIKSSTDRVGYVIAQADKVSEAKNICSEAAKTIRINTI